MEITDIINALISYGSVLMLVMYFLVLIVNVVVEVLKGVFQKLPTNFLVLIVAIVVTVLAMLIAAAVLKITVMWYYAVGAVGLGIFVAYAAMFGFDKFTDALAKLKDYNIP